MDYESKVQIVENYSMLIISSIATSTTLHLQMRTHWAARYGSYKNRRHSHKLSPSKSLMKFIITHCVVSLEVPAEKYPEVRAKLINY